MKIIKYWALNSLKKKISLCRMATSLMLQQRSVDSMKPHEITWFNQQFKEHDDKLAAIDLLMKEI